MRYVRKSLLFFLLLLVIGGVGGWIVLHDMVGTVAIQLVERTTKQPISNAEVWVESGVRCEGYCDIGPTFSGWSDSQGFIPIPRKTYTLFQKNEEKIQRTKEKLKINQQKATAFPVGFLSFNNPDDGYFLGITTVVPNLRDSPLGVSSYRGGFNLPDNGIVYLDAR